MRLSVTDHPFFALFPPYGGIDALPHPNAFPTTPLAPRGAALIWNLHGGDWGGGFKAVRDRPPGVALLILLPSSGHLTGLDRMLELMERCRPHSILPYQEELCAQELASILRRFPNNMPVEVLEYLAWRGIEPDLDTRRLIRKTLELSQELRTVSGLARSLYLSRRALGRRFMSRGLPPPSHWLHFGRLLRASLLLQSRGTTLHAVAGELGYPDGFSLSNQMHRLLGLRPSMMRECFGWEWVVEAWLTKEAERENLPHLRSGVGTVQTPTLPAASEPSLLARTGTGPPRQLQVAERPYPGRTRGGGGASG